MKTNEWGEVFGLLSEEEAEQLERVLRWVEEAMKENGQQAEWELERQDTHDRRLREDLEAS